LLIKNVNKSEGMHNQRTLAGRVEIEGIGLHSGEDAKIVIWPAECDHGIRFVRAHDKGQEVISANAGNITKTLNASTLGLNGTSISTVEHLMAAFYGLGIDNALIEVHGPEIPILDGSAREFILKIRQTGIRKQDKGKKFIVVRTPVSVRDDGKSAELVPAEDLRIKCTISYDHPLLAYQSLEFNFSEADFEKEIAPARTFGFTREIEGLKKNGLAKGGSLQNAIIIGEDRIINQDIMRFHDEFVRHKILDTLGDLMLLGGPVIARFKGFRSGHTLNLRLVRKLLQNPDNYLVIESDMPEAAYNNGFKLPKWITPTTKEA
jgi:UDP-3-O-[3-hydroxymyristoyl] N-acetylglucosamine deacetylase